MWKNLAWINEIIYNVSILLEGVIDISNTTEKIKILMIKCGTNQKELAAKLGISQPALSKKFKLNDWKESDLKKIANACGADFDVVFKFNNETI